MRDGCWQWSDHGWLSQQCPGVVCGLWGSELQPGPSLQLERSVHPDLPCHHNNITTNTNSGQAQIFIENYINTPTSKRGHVLSICRKWSPILMFYYLIWRTKLSKWSRFKLDSFVLPQPWTEQSVKCFGKWNSPLLSPNSTRASDIVSSALVCLDWSDLLCISDGIITNN